MGKWLRIVAAVACGLLLSAGIGLFLLYRASQQVPAFYREALEADPAAQRVASDDLLRQATELVSDVKNEDEWQAIFTEEQINGWLAVDLVENHRDALPRSVSDPRVNIEPGELTIACRFQRDDVTSVLSLTVDVYVPEPNVIALRVRKARAGTVPLPLNDVLERVTDAANDLDFPIRWEQADGDPVALVTVSHRIEGDKLLRIEGIRLGKDEVYVAGSTESAQRSGEEQ